MQNVIAFCVLSAIAADSDSSGGSTLAWEDANAESGIDCDEDDDESALAEPPIELPGFERHEVDQAGGRWWVRLDDFDFAGLDAYRLASVDRDATWRLGYAESEPWVEVASDGDFSNTSRGAASGYNGATTLILFSPPDAVPGEAFVLTAGDVDVAELSVALEPAAPLAATSLSITVVDQVPQKCSVRCRHPDLSIPRTPVLAIEYAGDPAPLSLTLRVACEGGYFIDMFADVFALAPTDGPLHVVDRRDLGMQGECTVSILQAIVSDPETDTTMVERPAGEDLGPLPAAPETTYDDDGEPDDEVAECSAFAGTIWDPETRTRDYGLPCACTTTTRTMPVYGIVTTMLVAVGLRSRRTRRRLVG